MIPDRHPEIPARQALLRARLAQEGVDAWLKEGRVTPDVAGLVYLAKFAYFTGQITKREIAELLGLDPRERRELVKSWYDEHRKRGCGTC